MKEKLIDMFRVVLCDERFSHTNCYLLHFEISMQRSCFFFYLIVNGKLKLEVLQGEFENSFFQDHYKMIEEYLDKTDREVRYIFGPKAIFN